MLSTLLPAATPAMVHRQSRSARLMRAIRAAQQANPRNAGPYPGAATITDNGAALPGQTSIAYMLNPSNNGSLGIWHVVGGRIYNGYNNIRAAFLDNAGSVAQVYARIEAMAEARYIAFRLTATALPIRILIDNRYLSTAGVTLATQSGTANQYILLDLGSRAVRRIAIELPQTASLIAAYVEPTAKMWPVGLGDAVHGVMLGDSYVLGSGPSVTPDGVAVQLGDWLGIHMLASGSGGTGWNQSNQGSGSTVIYRFDQRIANGDLGLSYYAPDIIFLMASYNDRTSAAAPITTNCLAGLKSTRSQYPEVPIIVFGACPGATGPSTGSPSIAQAESAVQAAITQFADPLCAFAPISTDPNGAWVTGTGKIGATTGSGNSDWATNADGVHPSDEGAAMIGRRYASAAITALRSIYQL